MKPRKTRHRISYESQKVNKLHCCVKQLCATANNRRTLTIQICWNNLHAFGCKTSSSAPSDAAIFTGVKRFNKAHLPYTRVMAWAPRLMISLSQRSMTIRDGAHFNMRTAEKKKLSHEDKKGKVTV